MILHIGVLHDVPELSGLTSYQVGQILEDKYGLFSAFYDMNKDFIDEAIADHIMKIQESITFGAPMPEVLPLDMITQRFREMLDAKAFDGVLPGVPTQASLTGATHRKKTAKESRSKTKVKRSSRPSFIDTGTLQSDLYTWID